FSPNISNHYHIPDIAVNRQKEDPLLSFKNFQAAFNGRILFCSPTLGRRETVSAFFHRYKIKTQFVDSWDDFINGNATLGFAVGDIAAGFILPEKNIAVISENDLYPSYVRSTHRKRRFASSPDMALRDLAEIKIGDPVVHESHGIGRYCGLVNMGQGGDMAEMMLIEYADNAKLYVPVSHLHLISRYAGASFDEVALHKLGSSAWQKAKRRAAQKAHDTAAELLQLYAKRLLQQGYAFDFDEEEYKAFADGFEYAETEDQAAAIIATIRDLMADKPMDRLICGDVGFGKTEVALRAAFVAVSGGKQVAVLAPTTLLVEQHTQVFRERFADFAVNVASLSRFNASRETQGTLKGLANGTVDIVIGTHKLVQPDIQFKNLGLLIIDEEHRFGVRQKEKLKQLRSNIDVLTMTATPIPRTLSMALDGLRDFSLITTAPERRLAVKTFVKPISDATIQEALLRELKRGGQVFFLHNEVDTIENARERLQNLVPEARIAVAHGQMAAGNLERVMRNFLQQQFNILVCSTIIETGIDIPNANTIIINRADKFGIAQLHQLRGRVGRSHHQAYAYLLTPEYITRDAQKRLDAVAAADELGAGFKLAMEDLEIRGAGEILGEGQSGDILQVGLTLYGEMLKQAVRDLKNGKIPDLDAPLNVSAEIKLDTPALLPETYCPDVHERLVLYKRLAACESEDGIDDIYEELVDRFGLPEQHFRQPEKTADNPIKTLIATHRLRLFAKAHHIQQIDANENSIILSFHDKNEIDPVKIITLLQSDRRVSLSGQNRLKIAVQSNSLDEKVKNIKEWVEKIQAA
ncbi:MAG: transcription-repair coupling factor, partial [Neisseriaceae bacterium]|nr:transcription-repair coupling factor [Neisseriaceae bacterium]